jgi:hypothetical protein
MGSGPKYNRYERFGSDYYRAKRMRTDYFFKQRDKQRVVAGMIDNIYDLKLSEAMDVPTDFKRLLKKLDSTSRIKIREYEDTWNRFTAPNKVRLKPKLNYDLIVSLPFPEDKSGLIDVLEIIKDAEKICKDKVRMTIPINSQEILMRCPRIDEKTAKKLITYKILLTL